MNNTVQRRMVSSISWCFVAFLFVTFALTELLATPAGHKISLKGVPSINSVVGNGSVGSDGNGVPATQATMNYPYGLATDSAGNLYLADSNNFLVRVVNRQNVAITVAGVTIQPGNIATVAGSGTQGNSGDGGTCPERAIRMGWRHRGGRRREHFHP